MSNMPTKEDYMAVYDQAKAEGDIETMTRAVEAVESMSKAEAGKTVPQSYIRGRGISGKITQDRVNKSAEELRRNDPELAEMIEQMGGMERFMVGVGAGFTDVGRGAGLADDASQLETKNLDALEDQSLLAKGGRIVGQAAPFAPFAMAGGALASIGGRIAAQSGVGALEGATIAKGTGGNPYEGAAIGATIGAFSETAMPVINSVFGQLKKKLGISSPTPNNQLTEQAAQEIEGKGVLVDDFMAATKEVAPGDIEGNAKREAVFQRMGITPTEAERTRDISLFSSQQDAFKRSGPVRDKLDKDQQLLTEKVAGWVTNTGGIPRTSEQSIIESVQNRSLRMDSDISDMYKSVRDGTSSEKVINLSAAMESLTKNAPLNERSQGTVKALRDQMATMGVAKNNGFSLQGRIDVDAAEELRIFANSLYDGSTPQAKQVIREFKNGLDDDVMSKLGKDSYKAARKAKADFEKGLTKPSKNKFDKNKTSLVRDILENTLAPEDFFNKTVRGKSKYKADDLADLKRYLTTQGSPDEVVSGIQSWNDLRAETMQYIQDTAFGGPESASGIKNLSRAKVETAFNSIGKDKMRVLFDEKERQLLTDLGKIAALKEAPSGIYNGSGPSGEAIKQLKSVLDNVYGARQIADYTLNKASNKQILKLKNDAEIIEKKLRKEAFNNLRRSKLGQAASIVPVAITAQSQSQDK
jgi:hypothetical protein